MRNVAYRWHLRKVMADHGMFATTDLVPLLAERGIEMSASQVYRLVTGTPERLNCLVLSALCDVLDCGPNELFEPYVLASTAAPKKRAAGQSRPSGDLPRPVRAKITDA